MVARVATLEGILIFGTASFVLIGAGLLKVPFGNRSDASVLLLANDPPLGASIPLPSKDALGRNLTKEKLWLIAVGSCTSCTLQVFDPTNIRSNGNRVALLIQARNIRELPQVYLDASKTQFIVLDPQGELLSRLNAFFMPRFYEIDSEHRLIRSSQRPNEVPGDLRK